MRQAGVEPQGHHRLRRGSEERGDAYDVDFVHRGNRRLRPVPEYGHAEPRRRHRHNSLNAPPRDGYGYHRFCRITRRNRNWIVIARVPNAGNSEASKSRVGA